MAEKEADTDQSTIQVPSKGSFLFTSEAALSLEEARTLTGRRGATLVLLVGEVGVGKTTLLVELWSLLLLQGSINSHNLAGSRTAMAFEERAYHSRIESRVDTATTVRTPEADDGFLHLRIQRPDGSLCELLFADITGEHFERIREGTPLLEELPWASRVDRFLVILDGKGYATPGEREIVLNRALRQILALCSSNAVNETARVAIAMTKVDELSDDDFDRFSHDNDSLLAIVQSIDDQASSLLIAARPAGGKLVRGVDKLIEWICSGDRLKEGDPHLPPTPLSRAIGRFTS